MVIFKFVILIIIAYLIGAIPTGVIISRRFFGFDIRTQGSGNMGSTNVMRVLGTKWGVIVQVLDILKGTIAVLLLANLIGNNWNIFAEIGITLNIFKIIIGGTAVLGHIFSCFVGFKGGKGVNTTLGMLIAILPIELISGVIAFVIIVGLSGFVSLGSMIGGAMLPLVLFLRYNLFKVNISDYFTLIWVVLGIAVLLIVVHWKNIIKLFKGTENRMEKMRFIWNCWWKTKEKVNRDKIEK